MKHVYISDGLKKNQSWQPILEDLIQYNITEDNQSKIALATSEELESFLNSDMDLDALVYLESTSTLFQNQNNDFRSLFVYKIEIDKINELPRILNLCFEIEEIKRKRSIVKMLNFTSQALSRIDEINDNENLQHTIFQVKAYLNIYRSIDKVLSKLNQFLESRDSQFKFYLFEQEELELREGDYLFSFDGNHFLNIEIQSEISREDEQTIKVIYSELYEFFKKYGVRNEKNIDTYWENIFAEFPIPMAIMTENGELLHRNKQFSKLQLLPKKCIEFTENQKIEAAGMVFICKRSRVEFEDETLLYFQFLGSDTAENITPKVNTPTFKDLGIVSSSIAHELNNPLAGILSALEVLKLLGEKGEELEDIKKAANRCKELVGVFLGFARSKPMATSENNSIPDLFLNALSLLRFRMVETGVRFEFDINALSDDKNGYNASILTMIFYLVLSDTFTAIERKKLVTGTLQEEGVFAGKFIYEKERMRIELASSLLSFKEVEFNKLIHNLLSLEKLDWRVEDKFIQMELK